MQRPLPDCLSPSFSSWSTVFVSQTASSASAFSAHVMQDLAVSDSQLSSHYWLIFTLSCLWQALKALMRPIIPLPCFFLDSHTLSSLHPLGSLDEKSFFGFSLQCRQSNKAKGEIIPEAVSALGGWNEFRTATEVPGIEMIECKRSGGSVETEYHLSSYPHWVL